MDPVDLRILARRLQVDSWAVEAVRALGADGVPCVLLKGPAIARWLYPDDPTARSYSDVDLLVRTADRPAARRVLERLGYVQDGDPLLPADEPHARAFRRPSDHAAVDLHTSFHGLHRVSATRVWAAMTTGGQTLRIGDLDVAVPAEPARALLLVLHVSPKNGAGNRAWNDLLDGLRLLGPDVWRRAVDLARELGVQDEVGHRLSLSPTGANLAVRLGLPTTETIAYAEQRLAEAGASPPGTGTLLRLGALPDSRARVRYVRDKLLPPADVVADRMPRIARLAGLPVARAAWLALCVARLPRSARAVVRLRRR